MEFDSHGHYNGKLLDMPLHRAFPDKITGAPHPPAPRVLPAPPQPPQPPQAPRSAAGGSRAQSRHAPRGGAVGRMAAD